MAAVKHHSPGDRNREKLAAALPRLPVPSTGEPQRHPDPRKIILKTHLSPGDLCTLTAAIESLHATYPGRFLTDVRTSCDDLFKYSRRITKLTDAEAETIEMHYTDLVNRSDDVPNSFLRGYCYDLGKKLGIPIELTTNRPQIYLSTDEQAANPMVGPGGKGPSRYWLVTAGIKKDFTLKQWPLEYYQQVVDHFRGKLQFVQVGSDEHDHPKLEGVINLVGQTDIRQLIQLVYHAQGGLGPITLLQHLCAAFEKPYMALLGGREPVIWTQYPIQTTFHTLGKLPCCRTRSCWRSRVVRLNDGCEQDNSLCDSPVLDMQRPVGKCMAIIKPQDVIRGIETLYEGGALVYADAELVPPRAPVTPATELEMHASNSTNNEPPAAEIVAHSAWGFGVKIVPAWTNRDWMDASDKGFAYHCLPMVMANQSGWFVLAPHDVTAEWNGGPALTDLKVEIAGEPSSVQALSSVGSGIVTWTIPYVFRTPPGWNLLCRGPANFVRDGIFPLEGLVETDWSFASFSMNWKFTRPGRCEFKEGEPIAMLVPFRRRDLEAFRPRFAELKENPELDQGYSTWIKSRQEFWEAQRRGDADALRQRFQKHYTRGYSNKGAYFADHQKSRELAEFSKPSASSERAGAP